MMTQMLPMCEKMEKWIDEHQEKNHPDPTQEEEEAEDSTLPMTEAVDEVIGIIDNEGGKVEEDQSEKSEEHVVDEATAARITRMSSMVGNRKSFYHDDT